MCRCSCFAHTCSTLLLWHRDSLGITLCSQLSRCPLQERLCRFFWGQLVLGIRNGTNSAAQADFALGSDNFMPVCCPWHGGAIWPCLDSRAVILHCLESQLLLMRTWAVLEWQHWQLGASLRQMERASITSCELCGDGHTEVLELPGRKREGRHEGGCRCDTGSQGRNQSHWMSIALPAPLKGFQTRTSKSRKGILIGSLVYVYYYYYYVCYYFYFVILLKRGEGKVKRECRRKEPKPDKFSEFVSFPPGKQKYRRVLALSPHVPSSP